MPLVMAIVLASICGQADKEAKRFDFEAETWIDPPAIRFPEDRSYAVLFFSNPTNREETETLKELFKKLEKLSRRKDFMVMALSPDKADPVRQLVKKLKVRLPVGADSESHRQFKIEDFPQLIILERGTDRTARWSTMSIQGIDSLLPGGASDGSTSEGFDQGSSIDTLTRHAYDDPDIGQRERALEILRGRMPSEEFLKLCDDLLAEGDPSQQAYGKIEYQRHLADPSITEKQPRLAPSALASQARRENPSDSRWSRVDDYEKGVNAKSLEQLWTDYQAASTDDPADLLIRREIASNLASRTDKIGARAMLMRMLPIENDAGVRVYVVGGMTDVCDQGDLEAAKFLEDYLPHETNILYIRPLVRSSIRYLRGETD